MKAQSTKNSKNSVLSKNNIASALKFNALERDNSGVSAVIGVILMVAITVILAAIIGVFVLNMSDNLPKNPGFASFEVVRADDGGLKITNMAMTGEPIEVIKLVTNGVSSYQANPSATASPIPSGTTIEITDSDLAKLTTIGDPVFIAAGADGLPSSAFVLTVIGQTEDGQQSILQTVNVPAA